jgi:heavy metal sensor kinase
LWFATVMIISLGIFGVLTYTSIANQLHDTLDVSLNKVVSAVDVVIRKQAEKTLNPPPRRRRSSRTEQTDELAFLRKDSSRVDSSITTNIRPLPAETGRSNQPDKEEVNPVWTEIFEIITLTPRNFLIEILDSNGTVVFKSDNLGTDSLAVPWMFIELAKDSLADFTTITQSVENLGEEGPQDIRVGVARSRSAIIIAGYPVKEVSSLLDDFFSALILLGPIVLVFSTIGGWFLARASLHPVDEITRTAQDITASNLSRRLPVPSSDDEIRRLSDTLNDMISRLESSFERVRQFTADASHELRTPLTIMTGELELALRQKKTPEEYQEVLSSALQEVLRLSRVVESLLLLSRADMGKISLHLEPTNLTEMLADLADAASVLGDSKTIYITFRPSADVWVNADRAKLYQMFLNLVDNAVKYTPSGGMISITVHRDNNFAEVRVRDTGIGISEENQKKIFDRFYRVDKARSRELGGVGLGLSIVQWTVEAHDGTIDVESVPGQGSTFLVRLPLYNTQPAERPAEVVHDEKSRFPSFELPKLLGKGKKSKV